MSVRLVSVVCLLGLCCLTAAAYPAQIDAGSKETVSATNIKPAAKISPEKSPDEKANSTNMGDKPLKTAVKKEGSTVSAQLKGKGKESGSLNEQKKAKAEDKKSERIKKKQTQLVTEPLSQITTYVTTKETSKKPTESFETDRPGLTNAETIRTEGPKSTTTSSEAVKNQVEEQSKASFDDKDSQRSVVTMVSAVVDENSTTSGVEQESTESPLMQAYIKWSNEFGVTSEKVPPNIQSNQRPIKPASAVANNARDRQRLRLVWFFIFPFTLLLF